MVKSGINKISLSLYGGRAQCLVADDAALTAKTAGIMEETSIRPALIIGVPAGLVGASEAKEQLMLDGRVPYIVVQGNKGGSPIAAAVVNALLYMIH